MANLPALIEHDPTELGWPASLPLELAAKTAPIRKLCEAYGIDKARWDELRQNAVFQKACEEAIKTVGSDNGAFKGKLATMAEALLPRMWHLANSSDLEAVPANVQSSLIQFAVRAAGLDASVEQKAKAQNGQSGGNNAFMININLR